MKKMLRGLLSIGLLLSVATMHADTRDCNTCEETCNTCETTCDTCETSCDTCDTSCDTDCNECDCSTSGSCTDNAFCKHPFLMRSQGENRARDYVGQAHLQNLVDQEDRNWVGAAVIAFNQSFRSHRLGEYFSPRAGSNSFTVGPDGGVGVDVRNVDLGLSPTFQGTLTLNPRIRNIVFEPSFFVGLDNCCEGLWAWFKIPVVNTRWDLDCCETDSMPGGDFFAPGFMTLNGTPAAVGAKTIQEAFSGNATFGDKKTGLKDCRIICCESNRTGVADLPLHLGYNFVRQENGVLGAYLRVVFPTGSTKDRGSIFDPQVGYGRWQVGAGLDGSWKFLDKNDTSINLYVDFYVTHMFGKHDCRCFDLIDNGCFSRYLLLKEFDANGVLTGNLFNVADKFTVCVKSKFDWNIEALGMFELKHKAWVADLGYNFWARDCEKFDCGCCDLVELCDSCCDDACSGCSETSASLHGLQYGIKGNTFANNTETESNSTIAQSGTIDESPVFINELNFGDMIDFKKSRAPRALSHKVFANLSYNFEDREYPIFVGVGGEAEFGNDNKALSQWGVWAKAGVSYS